MMDALTRREMIRALAAGTAFASVHAAATDSDGRHELDDKQEVRWDGVMRGILATSFQGYVAHEFLPTGDPKHHFFRQLHCAMSKPVHPNFHVRECYDLVWFEPMRRFPHFRKSPMKRWINQQAKSDN